MGIKKRALLKYSFSVWTTPIILSSVLPAHAQTSECLSLPTIPEPIPDITISDRGGADITPIDLSVYEQCGITTPPCNGYSAAGLPSGLSISDLGLITGSYNATGIEIFTIEVSAILCGENVLLGNFTLTINDTA